MFALARADDRFDPCRRSDPPVFAIRANSDPLPLRMTASITSTQGRRLCALGLACALALGPLEALTMSELLNDPKLTPKRFAGLFEDFDYEFSPEVLPAEVFLRERRGDCDDYAILADYVLTARNYDTRLIHIRMVGRVAHAVCYVTESRAYLDYNNRKYFFNLDRCGRTLREIATKVADSFEANWTSASEFTYDYREDRKLFGSTVVKTESPEQDPPPSPPKVHNLLPTS
jgi:hypothetical protein